MPPPDLWRVVPLLAAVLALCPDLALAQGALSNGGNHVGQISVAETDAWTFTARAGDAIAVTIGEVGDTFFWPRLRLYGPSGTLLAGNTSQAVVHLNVIANETGIYTVHAAADPIGNATGSYTLTLAHVPGIPVVSSGDEGGEMTSGANHAGSIHVGDLDQWRFTATAGDVLAATIGEVGGDTFFWPWLRLYGPTGQLLAANTSQAVVHLNVTAPVTGTYTLVVAADPIGNGSGDYLLTLARLPGTFVVPGGDEGGPMTNGANHAGAIHVGDLDQWRFSANAGDGLNVTIGEVGNTFFWPWLRLYGPTGTLLTWNSSQAVVHLTVTAPATGTYTVVAAADPIGDPAGNYLLTLARIPGTFVVPSADEGGPIATGTGHVGSVHTGDLDQWRFTAAANDVITVVMEDTGNTFFWPWARLYGPSGTLLWANQSNGTAQFTVAAPTTGTYTLVAAADPIGDPTGTYRLTVTGIPAQPPLFSYAALGDSYSSGEGLFPYTDTYDPLFGCHRSVRAYSTFVRRPGTLVPIALRDDSTFTFIACSGAVTNNVTATGQGQSGEPPQLAAINRIDANRDLVTISIGGNDAQFVKIVGYCLMHPSCHDARPFSPYLNVTVQEFFPLLVTVVKEKLRAVYSEIRTATPNAATIVLAYPLLVSGTVCEAVEVPSSESELSAAEQAALRNVNAQLNAAVQQAAAEIGLHFVPVADRFTGHEICGQGDDWINGLAFYNPKASFHPTTRGQLAYAEAINDYLVSTSTGWPYGYLPNGLPRNPDPAPAAVQQSNDRIPLPEVGGLAVLRAAPPAGCRPVDDLIVPGELARITGSGFAPSEVVTLSLVVSDVVLPLGTAVADASGNLTATVSIPSTVALGTFGTLEALAAGTSGLGRLLIALVRATGSSAACYTAPPTVATVSPATVAQGSQRSVMLTGTDFALPLLLDAGAGIDVTAVVVQNPTTATATLIVDAGAPLGMRSLTVTTPGGTSNPVSLAVYGGGVPEITAQPQSATVLTAQTVTLSVTVASASPLSYQWYLGPSGTTTSPIAGATTNTFTPPLLTTTIHNFWVRVSNSAGDIDSAAATITVLGVPFTDPVLTAGVNTLRAVHVVELRTRINAQRARFLLGGYSFGDPVLTAGVTPIRAQHILEMRTALAQAYAAAGRTPPTFTDPALGPGTPIRAIHVQQLRFAVTALEVGY